MVECHSCNTVGLLSGRFLLSLGFPPYTSIKNLQRHTRCRGCGVRGKGDISIRWGKEAALEAHALPHYGRQRAGNVVGRHLILDDRQSPTDVSPFAKNRTVSLDSSSALGA